MQNPACHFSFRGDHSQDRNSALLVDVDRYLYGKSNAKTSM